MQIRKNTCEPKTAIRNVSLLWAAITCFDPWNPHNNPMKKENLISSIVDEATEAQRSEVTCPKTHSQEEAELEFKPRTVCCKAELPFKFQLLLR